MGLTNTKYNMKPTTVDNLLLDQIDRIERSKLSAGDNSVLDFINEINNTPLN